MGKVSFSPFIPFYKQMEPVGESLMEKVLKSYGEKKLHKTYFKKTLWLGVQPLR